MLKFLRRLIVLGFVIPCGYQTYVVHKNVQNVLQYRDMIKEILDDNDTITNVDLVLVIVYTGTKGDDGDVMRSSESSDDAANSITDNQTSIRRGVTVLSENLTLADEAGVDIWIAVQAYNLGTVYIDYVVKNGGENTIALTTAYPRDVVAPSLGNITGETYFYYHFLALISGGKSYRNGGNIYYSREVHFNLYLIELMSLFQSDMRANALLEKRRMKELGRHFKGYLKKIILGSFFKLFEASSELLVSIIIARIVDAIIPHHDKNHSHMTIGLLFLLAIVGVLVVITAQYFSSKAVVGYTCQLTKDLFKKTMGLSKEDCDQLTTPSLVTRLTSDTYQIQTGINQFLRLLLRVPIIVSGAIIMAFTISPKMTIDLLLMVVILFAIVFTMSYSLSPIYAKIRQVTDRIVNMTRQQLEGARVIRAFGQVVAKKQEFAAANQDYTDLQIKAGHLSSLVTLSIYPVANSTLILVIWQGNLEIGRRLLSQGMLIASMNYPLQISTELLEVTMLVISLNQSFINAKRTTEVFEKDSEDLATELVQSESAPALAVKGMTPTYPTAAESSLSHIDFSVNAGDFLDVIGGTGSGKSTLVELLTHLYTPQEGSLVIFQNQHSPKALREWRSWVNVVPQKTELFQGTIRSNLTLGTRDEVSGNEPWRALDIAQASDSASEKEGQSDAKVEAFGCNFSDGQRQRLTIVRVFVRRAPSLILDDLTSALDYLTEAKLLSAIHEGLKEVTLVLISRCTNSLKAADKTLLLDKGHQLGFVSHDELLGQNDVYRAIHYLQY